MTTSRLMLWLMLVVTPAAGCANRELSPEPVPLDRVECARCRMLISSDSGGGEIVSATEATRFYDDIGCLAGDSRARQGSARAFVRVAGGQWTDARAASYAEPADARTAMGSGIAAFATAAAARAADRAGRALTFDEIVRVSGASKL